MGLFKLFKRNNTPPSSAARAEPSRLAAEGEAQRRQRDIARATTMKIDAIESAMTFDIFNTPEPAWGSGPPRARSSLPAHQAEQNLAPLELITTELLSGEILPNPAVAAQSAPVVEEIAILFANSQAGVAQQMLVDSLAAAGQSERTLWWMLFDLYQVTGQHEQFDSLSIDYASQFETSPPAWIAHAPAAVAAFSGVTPTQAFVGVLDGAIAPQLERVQLLAAGNPVLRLEFNRVSAVAPAGCALLLQSLKLLQAQKSELIFVGAAELAGQIRTIIHVGRRDETQAPWLLLLELLQLLNREKEFEETSMDFCVTFEVSPPSFVAAPSHVATAAKQNAPTSPDRFMLPLVIEGNTDALIAAIDVFAALYQPVVFDCSRLARIDLGAAGRLLSCLQPWAQKGKKIELRDLNHLVAALLRLLAFPDVAKIFPRKY